MNFARLESNPHALSLFIASEIANARSNRRWRRIRPLTGRYRNLLNDDRARDVAKRLAQGEKVPEADKKPLSRSEVEDRLRRLSMDLYEDERRSTRQDARRGR